MFKKENLGDILRPDRYLYILNRNCEQFEPDNPIYITTAESVYEHIHINSTYDELWSTRHFGPLVFYLAWENKCDDLIGMYKNFALILPCIALPADFIHQLEVYYFLTYILLTFSMVPKETERKPPI